MELHADTNTPPAMTLLVDTNTPMALVDCGWRCTPGSWPDSIPPMRATSRRHARAVAAYL
jgi:hypothetical protein